MCVRALVIAQRVAAFVGGGAGVGAEYARRFIVQPADVCCGGVGDFRRTLLPGAGADTRCG